jgi:hypothetical protein
MSEKRAHKRYEVDFLGITTSAIHAGNIEIIDISLNGIALLAPQRLNIGKQYSIKIQSKGKALSIKGIVIWSHISSIRKAFDGDIIPVYKAGLEFIDGVKYSRDDLAGFIETHRKKVDQEDESEYSPGKDLRRYHRARVNTPVKAFITDKTQCHPVKNLGYGGLCMECQRPMKINSAMPMMLNLSEDSFIVFKGRITSCLLNKKASAKVYTIGIEFSELSVKDRKVLTVYIRLLNTIDTSPSQYDTAGNLVLLGF